MSYEKITDNDTLCTVQQNITDAFPNLDLSTFYPAYALTVTWNGVGYFSLTQPRVSYCMVLFLCAIVSSFVAT